MTTFRHTPALLELARQVREIGGRYQVVVHLSQDAVDKAHALLEQQRDFFSVTPEMRRDVAAAAVEDFRRDGLVSVLQGAPEAIREHFLARFEGTERDTPMRANAPGWVAFKVAHGFDARVGIMTGALQREVATAPIELRKVS